MSIKRLAFSVKKANNSYTLAMPLSWNEIKTRANTFSKEWEAESREDAEAKSFWDALFNSSNDTATFLN